MKKKLEIGVIGIGFRGRCRSGKPVAIPDFTNGLRLERKTNLSPKYAF